MRRASAPPMELVERRFLALEGVRKGRSRFGNRVAYLLGTRELAHVHGPAELDLRLTRGIIRDRREQLREDPRVGFRPGRSDWLTVALRTTEDVGFAFELFEDAWRAAQ
jgi:hypothetical protein